MRMELIKRKVDLGKVKRPGKHPYSGYRELKTGRHTTVKGRGRVARLRRKR
jgi:hypothetical protein